MTSFSPQELKKAALALSERYRKGEIPYLRCIEDRYAYLVTRFPATQAALRRVLKEIDEVEISSYLDIGAGPGVSWDVVKEKWPSLQEATFIELDREFVKIGKHRLQGKPITWKLQSATQLGLISQQDLVLFSYSWGEIKSPAVLHQAWELCRQFLVIVEPGTPRGYEAMLKARDELIQKGGHVVAPCPHCQACPWRGGLEWCHFGVRLERSWEHQWMKEGQLGYEDEKLSYIILSRTPPKPFFGRLVKDSLRRKGHTILTLCTSQGIETKTVSKRDKGLFKSLNKIEWGDKILDKL